MRTRTVLAAVIVGAVLWAASPAYAWTKMISVSGSAQCQDGRYLLTWTLLNNDESGTVTLTDSSRPLVVPPHTKTFAGVEMSYVEFLPGWTNDVETLTVSWLDRQEVTQTATATITLTGECSSSPSPSPSPTTPPPTTGPPDPTPPVTSVPPLAFTGMSNATAWFWMIGGLVIVGLAFLYGARRVGRRS